MTDYNYNFFANRATQSLAQDTYYHTFYQVSQENPNTMITYTYDNNKNLIETFDVSFGPFSVSEALQILDQNGANPYVIGTNSSGFIPMNLGYFDIYNRFLTTSQHKGVMTKVNKTDLRDPPNLIGTSTGFGVGGWQTNGVQIAKQNWKSSFPEFFDGDYHAGGYYISNPNLHYVVNVHVTHPTNTADAYNFTAVVDTWTVWENDYIIRCNNCSTTSPLGDSYSVLYLYDVTP